MRAHVYPIKKPYNCQKLWEPLQTKESFCATAREFIFLSWPATVAFVIKVIGSF